MERGGGRRARGKKEREKERKEEMEGGREPEQLCSMVSAGIPVSKSNRETQLETEHHFLG